MNVQEEARRRWDSIAKPLHSLGRLEDFIVQIAGIQQTTDVRIDKRCAIVARSIAEGTGNINLMAEEARVDVIAVDMGMLTEVPGTVSRRIGAGTADITEGPAMTREQAEQALRAGKNLMKDMKDRGYQIAVVGEMGIGNTTAASAAAAVLLDLPVREVTGRGAGLSDAGLERTGNPDQSAGSRRSGRRARETGRL